MLDIEVAILSNRCGYAASRRRKRKVLYAGSGLGLERFLACANLFVADERHRYAVEYHFRVRCARHRSELWTANSGVVVAAPKSRQTWTDLCSLIDQFLSFPMTMRPSTAIDATPEHAVTLLLDDDELGVLLNLLFSMQQTCAGTKDKDNRPEVIQAHTKDGDEGDRRRGNDDSTTVKLLEPWRLATVITSVAATPTVTAFARCQQKLVELRQMKETLADDKDDDDTDDNVRNAVGKMI